MISFLYSTDWHAKDKSPSTRTDDYPSTIENKIRHFFRVGHELGVDAFLCGADYFDTPYVTPNYVTRIGNLIKDELKDKHLYGVWGNHDIVGWNPATVNRLAHGVFENFFDQFTILGREPLIFENDKGQKVKLSGVSSYAQLDRHIMDEENETIVEHRARDYVIEEYDGTPQIHIVHGYLSTKPILDEIPHTVIDEMKHTKAAVTLTGHEHVGFPVKKIDNGYVFNPGALGRVFASHSEMNRMPQFAYIKIHEDGTAEVEAIQCEVAKNGHEVMDRSALDAKKEKEALLEASKGNISELLKSMDIKGIDLNRILTAYRDTTRPDVYEEAKRRLNL